MGLDARAVSSGIASIQRTVTKFATDVPKKLFSLAKANIYMLAANLVQNALPTAQEFWDGFYGTDAEHTANLQRVNKHIHSLVDRLNASRESLASTAKDLRMKAATPDEQIAILSGDLAEMNEALDKQKEKMHTFSNAAKRLPMYSEQRFKYLEIAKNAEAKVNDLMTKRLKIQDAISASEAKKAAALDKEADVLVGMLRKYAELDNKREGQIKDRENIIRGGSDLSLGEAMRLRDSVRGEWVDAPHQLTSAQMDIIEQIRRLEWDAKQARITGRGGDADKLTMKSFDLRGKLPFLSDSERNPLGKINEAIIETSKHLRTIVDQANSEGGLHIKIKSVDL